MSTNYHLKKTSPHEIIKDIVTCKLCKTFFRDPVYLPCHCVVCKDHVSDMLTGEDKKSVRCGLCKKTHDVDCSKLPENLQYKKIIEAQEHLTDEEKQIKLKIVEESAQTLSQLKKVNDIQINFMRSYKKHLKDLIESRKSELLAKLSSISCELFNDEIRLMEESIAKELDICKTNLSAEKIRSDEASFIARFNTSDLSVSECETFCRNMQVNKEVLQQKAASLDNLKQSLDKIRFFEPEESQLRKEFGYLTKPCIERELNREVSSEQVNTPASEQVLLQCNDSAMNCLTQNQEAFHGLDSQNLDEETFQSLNIRNQNQEAFHGLDNQNLDEETFQSLNIRNQNQETFNSPTYSLASQNQDEAAAILKTTTRKRTRRLLSNESEDDHAQSESRLTATNSSERPITRQRMNHKTERCSVDTNHLDDHADPCNDDSDNDSDIIILVSVFFFINTGNPVIMAGY